MQKFIFLFLTLCFAISLFSQSNANGPVSTGQKNAARGTKTKTNKNSPTNGASWKSGLLNFNSFNDATDKLSFDTTFIARGPLQVVLTSDKPTQFKFNRDKFEITSFQNFNISYAVKREFEAGNANFTLYLYSGKLIVFKRVYSITFDGSLHPVVIPQSK